MAWNRNDSANRRNARASQAARTAIRAMCAVAALLAAAVAVWRLWPADGERTEMAKTRKPSHIREVAPNLSAPKSADGDIDSQGKEEKKPKVFVRYDERAEMYSMSRNTFIKIATDAHAIYKVNRLVHVNTKIFEQYLETFRL